MQFRLAPSVLAAACGAALAFAASGHAGATGESTGELSTGGTAKGDISSVSGETDRIGLYLVAGEPVKLKLAAKFAATLTVADPTGAPVSIGFTDGSRSFTSSGWVAPASGRFEFRIGSFDGTQGAYKLKATPAWAKTLQVGPFGRAEIEVPMPAGSRLAAAFKGTGLVLNQFSSPSGEVILAGVHGGAHALKVPATICALPGTYQLDVSSDPVFTGTITRILPKFRATNVKLTNGVVGVSFANDGVDAVFKTRCSSCHTFASSYAGARAFARDSLARMRSGNMPENGPRVPADQIDLVDQWIKTGMQR